MKRRNDAKLADMARYRTCIREMLKGVLTLMNMMEFVTWKEGAHAAKSTASEIGSQGRKIKDIMERVRDPSKYLKGARIDLQLIATDLFDSFDLPYAQIPEEWKTQDALVKMLSRHVKIFLETLKKHDDSEVIKIRDMKKAIDSFIKEILDKSEWRKSNFSQSDITKLVTEQIAIDLSVELSKKFDVKKLGELDKTIQELVILIAAQKTSKEKDTLSRSV